jgi:exonuclease III
MAHFRDFGTTNLNDGQETKGMRLNHFLLSPNLSVQLVDGGVDRWARGQENASDHAPAWIMLDF